MKTGNAAKKGGGEAPEVFECFGENVFSIRTMKDYLSEDTCRSLAATICHGRTLDRGIADEVAGNLILKALPEKPLQFNFILIAIDPESWTIRAVEHFNRQNELVNQMRFLAFKSIGDSLYFPVTVKTSTIIGEQVMVETTKLSRIGLNDTIKETEFRIPDNDNTKWLRQRGENER